ncbi:hypothetical protein F985_03890 [Acinetobacter seifertii]|uniref:Uncharacterized protein n=1 Tax=Acinetobacter seifertii TaxID=1530123 RepID=N8QW88_9GAMM|nr:hypothetical protein [Acinetobacter seifertii]ENU42991.1 hypothetical protein F985_03890 [Acinetobacter seifertii]
MAKCEICKKSWLFSKTVKCDCHKKQTDNHTYIGSARLALLSDPPQYPQRDPDPNLQYYSTYALQGKEANSDNYLEERFQSSYNCEHSQTNHSNQSNHSSNDSSGWSSSESNSCDSGSSPNSDSW